MASVAEIASQQRGKFMTSDDAMMKQILATHGPDGREIDVKPILQIVEEIFNFTAPATSDGKVRDAEEDKSKLDAAPDVNEFAPYIINRLSSEISYKTMGGSTDAHPTTVYLLNIVSSYTWEAKLVLTLAAFALNYGEFWLLAQIYSTNKLANKMKILKVLPDMAEDLKAHFYAIDNLIKPIMDLSKCIVELTELPQKYISPDNAALSSALGTIPLPIYWIFRSVVYCAAHIASLVGMNHELTISPAKAWELSTLTHKIKTMHEPLKEQLNISYQQIEEKKQLEAYDTLQHTFQVPHIDNMKILKSLIYPKDDILPLIDGSTKKRVSLEVLRRKTVLLLISGLGISQDEIVTLEAIYNMSRVDATRLENQYEIVWIPYVDHSAPWTDDSQRQFEILQENMPWHIVYHPSLIDQAAHRFIKENWQFNKKAILVVLDAQGKVASSNAFHMMWIWGSLAFPFTSNREEALWKEETWRLELVVDAIEPAIFSWITEGRHIILYGGDDMEWIRRFTARARFVARSVQIPLEMLYVGKSSKLEQVRKITAIIQEERLSHVLPDTVYIWFFWTRLESMLFSKLQLGSADEGDFILQEVKKLLSFDKTGVWAMYSRGSNVVINGLGGTVFSALQEFDEWKKDVETKGYVAAFKEHYEKLHHVADHPCCRFEFPTTVGRIPKNLKCPECHRSMEKFVGFSCCHDETPI